MKNNDNSMQQKSLKNHLIKDWLNEVLNHNEVSEGKVVILASDFTGRVKVKADPLFFKLLAEIEPPFFSINSLQIISPRPVPGSPFVPSVDFKLSTSNMLCNFDLGIPTPVSSILKVTDWPD